MASFLEDVTSIKLLQSLLQPDKDSSDSEDDLLLPNTVHKCGLKKNLANSIWN